MGEENAERSEAQSYPTPLTAEQIAGTWCGDTGVMIGKESSPRDATAITERPPPPPSSGMRFTVVRELGRGGMGRVEEVFDAVLGRSVAQKSVLPGAGFLPTTLLVSEAQTCAQLEHPSIVPVYDFGPNAEGFPQYTMRLVRGRTLREVLAERESQGMFATLAQKLGVLRQVCLAVAYAHERGVVHRDLKPDNVICGEFGEVYVLDWGIAHLVEGSDVRRAEHQDVQAGSPGYMAPEQVLGTKITPATDVFALGAMLYEVVTGERAFEDRDVPSMLRRCAAGIEAPPSSKGERVPRSFDGLISECLSNEPTERPPVRHIATAIDAYLDGERVRAERVREAEQFSNEGEDARREFEELTSKARAIREEAETALERLPIWEQVETKRGPWDRQGTAQDLARDASRSLARAQAAFIRALGRVPDHERARRGLASLHYRLFQVAEMDGDAEGMAQQLDLARAYDTGELALELSNEGALVVFADADVRLSVRRFVSRGLVSVAQRIADVPAGQRLLLEAGSYLVVAEPDDGRPSVRYPLRIERARLHKLSLRVPAAADLPEGMVLIPGGPFLGARNAKATRMVERTLPDFAIGQFPITWRKYVEFLDALDETERLRRLVTGDYAAIRRVEAGRWELTPYGAEGAARDRIPPGRELDLPASQISWFDAMAYASWLSERTGLGFRLPTELEWEKALRGADGRRFAMGDHLDPCLAKLRESRPEPAQPEIVGAFETDESPFGVRDLTGGVGDWTSTLVGDESAPSEAAPDADTRQGVWRGGCYGTTALFPHAMRYTDRLRLRPGWVGFRLALSLDAKGSSELSVEPMRRR